MPHLLSTKLDATMRYAGGLYGLATAVLADIANALSNAATGIAAAAAAQSTANGAVSTMSAHAGSGATAHALATASAHGFMSSTQFSKLATLAAGVAGTVGRLTADAFLEAPTGFAYAANISLDTSIKNDFVATGALTGNTTITFQNSATGHQGFIAVRQDATGNRTVTFASAAGYTIMRDAGTANLQPAPGANAITIYTYTHVMLAGSPVLFIGKLTPVAA